MSAPVLSVRLTSKNFGDNHVLGQISLDMKRGDKLAILGPSGIGKTTLLRLVAGLDKRLVGSITRPERIAMVFQEPLLLPWRSAVDNITIATGADRQAAEDHLTAVGLAGRGHEFPSNFSLGQQRRLSLARALAARPDLLILDEPFASLDEKTSDLMISLAGNLIRESNVTTLFVTHSRSEADRLVDCVVLLDGSPATLHSA
jgi:NitT/TauT family transport system ATP-binding protein